MRKLRIWCWVFTLLVLAGLVALDEGFKERNPIYVYAPTDMEEAFNEALRDAGMKSEYQIVMTAEKESANIIVESGKEMDPEYTKIAFSPFVVAYAEAYINLFKLVKAGVISNAAFNNSYYEVDVLKIIEEVAGEGKWENLKVYYPAENTPYWPEFYDFMLVAINGGEYPKTEEELHNAVQKVESFKVSKNTEAVEDFGKKISRNGGFFENAFYILPEKAVYDISNESMHTRLFYPLTTIYFSYYIKADELGSRITEHLEDVDSWQDLDFENFYDKLSSNGYRTSLLSDLSHFPEYIAGARNAYNVVELDKGRLRQLSMSASR